MRDSALKHAITGPRTNRCMDSRRRAHARQRFETIVIVGENTVVLIGRRRAHARQRFETRSAATVRRSDTMSEKSSCATAL